MSEIYYLLGSSELFIGGSSWLSPAEAYLEKAIRVAPKQKFAQKAYQLYEENIYMGYTGSSGTHIPDDVKSKLLELRKLSMYHDI